MLAPFTIDPDAIKISAEAPNFEDILRQLASVWLDLGVLMVAEGSQCRVFDAVSRLPQGVQLKWQRLLVEAHKQGRLKKRSAPWPPEYSPQYSAQIQSLSPFIRLLLAEKGNAVALGLRNGNAADYVAQLGIELCDFNFPSAAATFTDVRTARQGAMVRKGQSVHSELDRLFGVIAAINGEVVVVDKWAMVRFIQHHLSATTSGIENLFSFLGAVGIAKEVTIFCPDSLNIGTREYSMLRKVAETRLGRTGSKVALRLVEEAYFKENQHFRYLRIGKEVCIIDEGLQAFEGPSVARSSPCSFRSLDQNLQHIEADLRRHSRGQTILDTR